MLLRRASVLFIALYFVWFAFDGTRVGWTEDDPMNLYLYWKPGLAKVALVNIEFWSGFYRPLGGLFYLPIYAVAGMNPAPYRWAMLALLGLNAFLIYRLGVRLSDSYRMAGFAALFACVHGAMADLVYNTSSIYDVLAVTFSLLALLVYAANPVTLWRFAGVLGLMILALNAKEIAATLPAFLLLYEVIFRPAELRRNAWWSFAALGVAAIAMYGKMHGPDAMTLNESYRPIFTFSRWLKANVSYTGTMLYREWLPAKPVVELWILMALATGVAWRFSARKGVPQVMAWAFCGLALSTIPISFIPKRVGGSLYLPLVMASIWAGALFEWLIPLLSERRAFRIAATCLVASACFGVTQYGFATRGDWWRRTQGKTDRVLATLQNFAYRPPHGKRVLFLGSPYKDAFDLVFLANLVWNDHTLDVVDANTAPADASQFDVIIGFKTPESLELLKP